MDYWAQTNCFVRESQPARNAADAKGWLREAAREIQLSSMTIRHAGFLGKQVRIPSQRPAWIRLK